MEFISFLPNGILLKCVRHNNYPDLLHALNKGADVNLANEDGTTPLSLAIFKGYLPLAATLLQKGAQVDRDDKKGVCFSFVGLHYTLLFEREISEQ